MSNDPAIRDENYQATLRVLDASGNIRNLKLSATGNGLGVSLIDRLDEVNDAILSVPKGHSYYFINSAGTAIPKSAPGAVREIRVLGGVMGQVDVYDNTAPSGTKILNAVTPAGPTVLLNDVQFINGLTIVTAMATLILVTYR